MPDENERWKRARRARTLSSLVSLAVFSGVWLSIFFGRALSENGGDEIQALLSVLSIIIGFIPFTLLVMLILWLLGGWGIRQRLLSRDSIAIPSWLPKSLLNGFRERAASLGLPRPSFQIGVTLTADESHLKVWAGYFRPFVLVSVAWRDISAIVPADIRVEAQSYRGIRVSSPQFSAGMIEVPLMGGGLFGLFPISRNDWQSLAAALSELHTQGHMRIA